MGREFGDRGPSSCSRGHCVTSALAISPSPTGRRPRMAKRPALPHRQVPGGQVPRLPLHRRLLHCGVIWQTQQTRDYEVAPHVWWRRAYKDVQIIGDFTPFFEGLTLQRLLPILRC